MGQQWRRRVALLPLAIAIAPGFTLMLGGTAHAAFSGGITSPTSAENGRVIRTHGPLTLSSEVRRDLPTETGTSTLSLRVPGETSSRTLAQSNTWSNNTQALSFSLDTECVVYSTAAGPCTGPAANGGYQVTLSGPRNDTRTFTVEVPPATPSGLQATEVSGEKAIRVNWNANAEPDITGYDVYSGSGALLQGGLTTTAYEMTLPSSGYGGDYTFAVLAIRSAGPGTGRTLASPLSSGASVTVSEPEPEPNTSDPDSGGSTGGSTGSGSSGSGSGGFGSGSGSGSSSSGSSSGSGSGSGSTGGSTGGSNSTGGSTGGSTDNGGFSSGNAGPNGTKVSPQLAQRRAFGLTFKSFAPKLGQPKLPPLPKFAEPVEPDGTYESTLDFGEQEVAFPETVTRPGGMRGVIDTVYSTVFEGRRLWTSLAWGVLLMLGAGHVRVFLGHPTATD